jgi:hypothetical protein
MLLLTYPYPIGSIIGRTLVGPQPAGVFPLSVIRRMADVEPARESIPQWEIISKAGPILRAAFLRSLPAFILRPEPGVGPPFRVIFLFPRYRNRRWRAAGDQATSMPKAKPFPAAARTKDTEQASVSAAVLDALANTISTESGYPSG